MIPTTTAGDVPASTGKLLFHVIVNNSNHTFSINGPDGPNGVRLHYEMMMVARAQQKHFREFDLRARSLEAALVAMREYFSDYKFLGPWTSRQVQPWHDERDKNGLFEKDQWWGGRKS